MKKNIIITALSVGLALLISLTSCQTGVEEKFVEKKVEKKVEKTVDVEKKVPVSMTSHEAVAVYHYKQDINGIGYTKVTDEENTDGTIKTDESGKAIAIETSVKVAANTKLANIAKKFYGFTAKGLVESQQADGNYVVNIYYDRNIVTITARGDGISVATSGLYGSSVDFDYSAITKVLPEDKFIASSDIPLTYPAENKSYSVTLGKRTVSDLDGFVSVPAGSFKCGYNTAYKITLSKGLYACDHEVTQGEWERYMTYYGTQKGEVTELGKTILYAPQEKYGKGKDYPVYFVNWYEAVIYCNLLSKAKGLEPAYYITDNSEDKTDPDDWINIRESYIKKVSGDKYYYDSLPYSSVLNGIKVDISRSGYRLPTKAEWEYLALGSYKDNSDWDGYKDSSNTSAMVFAGYDGSNSDKIGDYVWYNENSKNKSHEIKGKLPNSYGLYDMSGNVMEWCHDWFGPDVAHDEVDPVGESSGQTRVLRGGSWNEQAERCLANSSGGTSPNGHVCNYGFRIVRTAQQ